MAKYKMVNRKQVKNSKRKWFKGQIPCVKKSGGYYYCKMAEGRIRKVPRFGSTKWISNDSHKGRTMADAIESAYNAM